MESTLLEQVVSLMRPIPSSRRAVTKAVMGNWCKFAKSLLASRKLMLVPLMVTSILICLLLHGRYWSRGNHNDQHKIFANVRKFQCCILRRNLTSSTSYLWISSSARKIISVSAILGERYGVVWKQDIHVYMSVVSSFGLPKIGIPILALLHASMFSSFMTG